MNRVVLILVVIVFLFPSELLTHPGAGIVVDKQGNVYFVDTGSGVWKIDPNGTLTHLPGPAYHWMAIDADSRLKNVTLPHFSYGDATVARAGLDTRILLSSDFPITIGPDGSLYYPWAGGSDRLQIFRLTPSGKTAVFQPLPTSTESEPLRWLNGIAVANDGSVYYSENRAIRKITHEGKITTVVASVMLSECESLPGVEAALQPYFRGLDVDDRGTVYVAATGCGAVLKITADGKITVILRTSSPWSPTSVAVSGTDLYVLEYLHTPGDNRRDWLPRVRKVTSDGRAVTIATIERR